MFPPTALFCRTMSYRFASRFTELLRIDHRPRQSVDYPVDFSGAVAALAFALAVADSADHGIAAQIGVPGNAVAAVRTAARTVAVGTGVVAVPVGLEFAFLIGVDRRTVRPVSSVIGISLQDAYAGVQCLIELFLGDWDVVDGPVLHPDRLPVFGDGENSLADIHVESGIGTVKGPQREAEGRKFVAVGRFAREDEPRIAVSGQREDSDEGTQLFLGKVNGDELPFLVRVAEVAVRRDGTCGRSRPGT